MPAVACWLALMLRQGECPWHSLLAMTAVAFGSALSKLDWKWSHPNFVTWKEHAIFIVYLQTGADFRNFCWLELACWVFFFCLEVTCSGTVEAWPLCSNHGGATTPKLFWVSFVDNLRNLLLHGQSEGFGLGEIISPLLVHVMSSFAYTTAGKPKFSSS